jgi:TonB family protein
VYASAAFNGPKEITGIAFRRDESNAPTGGLSQLNDVFVTLSVTSKAIGQLDGVFANNLTGQTTTVYSGILRFNWSASAGPARPFDIRIPFQRPFRYDPSLGNLLLDVTVIIGNSGGSSMFALDAAGDSHLMSQVSLESTSPTGWRDATGATRNVGLVTQFVTGPLPEQTAATTPPVGDVVRLGPGVSPPTILSRVEPEYTEEARAARYQGTVVLEVIVRADGTADIARIVRPLGLGLDEAAMKAVKQWRFRPGVRNGQPVDVLLNIEVSFNLK